MDKAKLTEALCRLVDLELAAAEDLTDRIVGGDPITVTLFGNPAVADAVDKLIDIGVAAQPMAPPAGLDSARMFLLIRDYPSHVIEGGLTRLLDHWEQVSNSVARGETQYYNDYINDMDGRHILEEMLPALSDDQRAIAIARLEVADSVIRPQLVPTSACIRGDDLTSKYGYVRERHWWYYHRPQVIDESWS